MPKKKKEFANLVAINDVTQTKEDQEKWQYQWSKEEVCYTEKNKEKNPGKLTMVRHGSGLKIITTVPRKNFIFQIANESKQLKEF